MDWWDLINPCTKLEVSPGEMGSLTINWRSSDNMGIGKPPAESIAAVDPAAVDTLRPLDREFTKGEHGWSSLLILQTRSPIYKFILFLGGEGSSGIQTNIGKCRYMLTEHKDLLEWELWNCCWTWMCDQNIIKSISWKHLWVHTYGYPCQFWRNCSTLEDVVQYLWRKTKKSKFSKDQF